MDTKRDEVRNFVKRKARTAVAERIATMGDRPAAEVIRVNMDHLCGAIAYKIADTYPFLELADIMEWKRTRVRK